MNREWLIMEPDTKEALNKYLFNCIQSISLSLLLQVNSRVLLVNLSIYCKISASESALFYQLVYKYLSIAYCRLSTKLTLCDESFLHQNF